LRPLFNDFSDKIKLNAELSDRLHKQIKYRFLKKGLAFKRKAPIKSQKKFYQCITCSNCKKMIIGDVDFQFPSNSNIKFFSSPGDKKGQESP